MEHVSKILVGSIAGIFLVAGLSTEVRANIIQPGGTAILSTGTSLASRPELAGTQLEAVRQYFSFPSFVSGWIENYVFRESSTGTLDFLFLVHNDSTSVDPITQIDFNNFGDFSTDVDWRTEASGHTYPYSATRSSDGNTVSFNYGHIYPDRLPLLDIHGGYTTFYSFIKTDATVYNNNGSVTLWSEDLFQNWSQKTLTTFQPSVSEVPIPAAVWLFGSALAGFCFIGKRRPY